MSMEQLIRKFKDIKNFKDGIYFNSVKEDGRPVGKADFQHCLLSWDQRALGLNVVILEEVTGWSRNKANRKMDENEPVYRCRDKNGFKYELPWFVFTKPIPPKSLDDLKAEIKIQGSTVTYYKLRKCFEFDCDHKQLDLSDIRRIAKWADKVSK